MQQLRFLFAMALLFFSLSLSPSLPDIDVFRGESSLSANFVIPNGRIRLIQLSLGVLVLVSHCE